MSRMVRGGHRPVHPGRRATGAQRRDSLSPAEEGWGRRGRERGRGPASPSWQLAAAEGAILESGGRLRLGSGLRLGAPGCFPNCLTLVRPGAAWRAPAQHFLLGPERPGSLPLERLWRFRSPGILPRLPDKTQDVYFKNSHKQRMIFFTVRDRPLIGCPSFAIVNFLVGPEGSGTMDNMGGRAHICKLDHYSHLLE